VEMMDPMPAVLAVVAVLALALWWLRKKGTGGWFRPELRRKTRRLESMERLALAPNHLIHLVRVDDRVLLIAQSPAGLVLIEGTTAAPPAAAMRAAAAECA
jgi:flagellar biogenesis protein FliO